MKNMRTLLAALVVFVVYVAALPMAGAQESDAAINVAVLNLEGEGVDPALLETLTSVLRNEAQQHADYDIVNQSPVNLSEIVVVLGCDTNDPSCLEQAAEQLEASTLIYGTVDQRERTHQVTIEIFEADRGEAARRFVRTIVDDEDPVAAFREQIQPIFAPDTARHRTRLRIGAGVEGAKVRVNDISIGEAPMERTGLPSGTYEVEVSHDGYTSWSRSVELSEGDDIRLWAPLREKSGDGGEERVATSAADAAAEIETGWAGDEGGPNNFEDAGPPPPSGVDAGTNWGAWSVIGVGTAALGASLAFGGLIWQAEDDLAAHDARRNQMTRETYLTDRSAIVDRGDSYELAHRMLLGVGAVSVLAGTTWLVFGGAAEQPAAEARRWDVDVSPRGVSALVNW